MRCLELLELNDMETVSKNEAAAMDAAEGAAGRYIEKTGKTDMADWTEEQWFGFIDCVISSFVEDLKVRAASPDAPF